MRTWHALPSGLIAAVGLWVCWVSFTREPSGAYLFPRLVSACFAALSAWTFGKAALGLARTGDGVSRAELLALLPGFLVMLAYVFLGLELLGFYTATAACFFILLCLYDPASHRDPRAWARRIAITAGFLAVLYGLFSALLKVHTPGEPILEAAIRGAT